MVVVEWVGTGRIPWVLGGSQMVFLLGFFLLGVWVAAWVTLGAGATDWVPADTTGAAGATTVDAELRLLQLLLLDEADEEEEEVLPPLARLEVAPSVPRGATGSGCNFQF